MRSVDAVKKGLAAQSENLGRLQEVKKTSEQRTAQIEKARSAYLVGALTGNAEAQKKLDAANEDLGVAQRDERDVDDAILQVKQEIARLDAALRASESEALRENARKLIEARINDKRELRIKKLADELQGELEALEVGNSEIVRAMYAYDHEAGNVAAHLLSCQADPVRVDKGRFGEGPFDHFVSGAPVVFSQLLKRLDREGQSEEAVSEKSEVSETVAK
jgi:DNA repair exonuclease SbcCD ATPase subunit